MGTVSKALSLLDILAGPEARLGLTEIARASGFDKATTRRLLVELKANGLVEQDDTSRDYMLGPSLLRLGRLREARFPFARIADPVVRALAEATGETAHASEYGGGVLASVAVQASDKSNRVIVNLGERLPLHATASGLAVLAASLRNNSYDIGTSQATEVARSQKAPFTGKLPGRPDATSGL